MVRLISWVVFLALLTQGHWVNAGPIEDSVARLESLNQELRALDRQAKTASRAIEVLPSKIPGVRKSADDQETLDFIGSLKATQVELDPGVKMNPALYAKLAREKAEEIQERSVETLQEFNRALRQLLYQEGGVNAFGELLVRSGPSLADRAGLALSLAPIENESLREKVPRIAREKRVHFLAVRDYVYGSSVESSQAEKKYASQVFSAVSEAQKSYQRLRSIYGIISDSGAFVPGSASWEALDTTTRTMLKGQFGSHSTGQTSKGSKDSIELSPASPAWKVIPGGLKESLKKYYETNKTPYVVTRGSESWERLSPEIKLKLLKEEQKVAGVFSQKMEQAAKDFQEATSALALDTESTRTEGSEIIVPVTPVRRYSNEGLKSDSESDTTATTDEQGRATSTSPANFAARAYPNEDLSFETESHGKSVLLKKGDLKFEEAHEKRKSKVPQRLEVANRNLTAYLPKFEASRDKVENLNKRLAEKKAAILAAGYLGKIETHPEVAPLLHEFEEASYEYQAVTRYMNTLQQKLRILYTVDVDGNHYFRNPASTKKSSQVEEISSWENVTAEGQGDSCN